MLIFTFILGTLIGSFINCVVYRIEEDKSFIKGRSYCPNCKETIKTIDLIPIISFLFLKGKCRNCGSKISLQYPLVEFVVGILFATMFLVSDTSTLGFIEVIYYYLIFSLLTVIFIYDLKHYIIPDKMVFSAIGLSSLWQLLLLVLGLTSWFNVGVFLLSGLLAGGFFLIIFSISKGKWMGFGDVKLAFFMGLFLGMPKILVALFSSFAMGAIISVIMMGLKKKEIKSEIPFGPFLVSGTLVAFLWGGEILSWYLSLLR